MRSLTALLALALSGAALAGDIYRWVDEQGAVHFGDLPPAEGAEPVQLRHYRPAGPASSAAGEAAAGEDGAPPSAAGPYRTLGIAQPEDGATLRSDAGKVGILVRLQPDLLDGHYLELTLDGVPLGGRQTRTALELQDVTRGRHEIQVRVFDADGNPLGQSERVRFYLRQSTPFEREGAEQDYQQWLTELQQERQAEIERERRDLEARQRRELEAQKQRVEQQRRSDFQEQAGDSVRYDPDYREVPAEAGEAERYRRDSSELQAPERPVSTERRQELETYDPAAIPAQPSGESADFDPATAPRSQPITPYTGPAPNPAYAPSYSPPAPSAGD
jgi:hypothetical protein